MTEQPPDSARALRRVIMRNTLAETLRQIERHDVAYERRYGLVLQALALAVSLEYPAGIKLDPLAPAWPVVYLELPKAGQVSWHVPQYPQQYDGHSTPEKYTRCRTYIGRVERGEAL